MDDIIATIPVACGDKDCKAQWHLSHYWFYPDDNTYSECDTDGNHEPVDEADVPTPEQQEAAWLEYYEYVAQTGHDPVSEFVLPTTHKKTRQWQARLRNWIGATQHGLKVSGVRRRGRGPWIDPQNAPTEVRDYLLIKNNRNCIEDYHTFQQMKDDGIELSINNDLECVTTFTVDEAPAPWSEERVQSWLKRKAKESIQERKKRKTPRT